jgi:hypothetical protein
VLVAINTFPRAGIHAVILADPDLRLHLSVQAAAANPEAINFYVESFGIRCVVLSASWRSGKLPLSRTGAIAARRWRSRADGTTPGCTTGPGTAASSFAAMIPTGATWKRWTARRS